MEISQIIILIIPLIFFLSLIIILKIHTKNWLHPATFYSLIWFILIILPLIFLPNEITSSLGIYWILFTSIVFSAGALLTTDHLKNQDSAKSEKDIKTTQNSILKQIRILVITSILIGILASLITIIYQGEFSSLLSLNSYTEITKTLSYIRYYSGYVPPLLSQILLFAVYLSPLLGGILFSIKKTKRDLILSISSIIPAILIFLLHTTRYPVIASIVLWLSAYFSFNIYLNKRIKIITKKTIIASLLILIFLFLITFATLSLRIGRSTPSEYISYQIQTEKATLFGHLPAFSHWFKDSYNSINSPSIGRYTFSGIFNILKIKERTPGLYTDYVTIERDRTNIFTAHRGLIEDFNLIGSLIFIFLIGMIVGKSYSETRNKNLKLSPILTLFYSFTFLSFIASILNYNSIILAILIYSVIIFSLSKKLKKPR